MSVSFAQQPSKLRFRFADDTQTSFVCVPIEIATLKKPLRLKIDLFVGRASAIIREFWDSLSLQFLSVSNQLQSTTQGRRIRWFAKLAMDPLSLGAHLSFLAILYTSRQLTN
eukprot:Plantae.Rhodophyta-Rhodochaete_pulchella.ctg65027.p1 GENE.Plantae.Rhodophyta-Rhodochaete_pulchella.ctg65027~~Plantae.Rhodophyta-Rhodochaete_pulchella.ctg65027.p1  ORF type:complete len:112 (+),score=4.58 Plantae.Rhodophyta-Rhodochaete_pulchella.ctg65027:91-426(+)